MLPNAPEYPIITMGILAAGGVVTTLNPIYTAFKYEVQRLLRLSEASLIVINEDLVPTVKEALKLAKRNIPIISLDITKSLIDGTISYEELVEENHVDLSVLNEVKRNYDDLAILLYSSDTTGLPKGVELTHKNIISYCEQQNTEFRQYAYTTASHQDTTLVNLPMFHCYGLTIQMIHKMSVGLKLVTLPKFQPGTFINVLLINKIHLMYLAPPLVMFLGGHPQVTANHLEHVRTITSGAAPLPLADIQNCLHKAQRDINFSQAYGMTEASPLVSLTPPGHKNYQDVGYGIPNMEMRIVNSAQKNLGPGDVKGYQVPPAELESVLKEHPVVLDAAGVPDNLTGERPRAFVVLKQEAQSTDKEIMNFVNGRVAPFKKIKQVSFLDSIPKNTIGKILRKAIKDQYC